MTEMTHNLAALLCQSGLMTNEQVDAAEKDARENHRAFISSVVIKKFVSSCDIVTMCAEYFKLPILSLCTYDAAQLDGTIEPATLNHYHVLPTKRDHHSLQLAMSDPTNHAAIAAIRFHTGLSIHPVLVDESELEPLIQKHCRPHILSSQMKSALARIQEPVHSHSHNADKSLNEEPVIQFVNQLLRDAVMKEVSDIHIETFAATCRIRFRRDGLLHETATLPHHLATRMVTRLKIMADLDITEKRLPQDGRFHFDHHPPLDFRVSTCPGLHGENIVLRLLQPSSQQFMLDSLGMSAQQLAAFQTALNQPQGLILVSGPTGSGKTATLYSALHHLNQPDKNILTVEDPVEIDVSGITQVNVNPRIGLDFATVLRAFLRQDPDIIMVGEIRDAETASIAVQAAQTGHLVLATLHANSAIDCIKRLLALGVSSCQLAGSLSLLAAQRLVRKLCQHCAHEDDLNVSSLDCDHCCKGFLGRAGIFEIIPVSSIITQHLLSNAGLLQIEQQILNENHENLFSNGLAKVQQRITSHHELLRVTGNLTRAA